MSKWGLTICGVLSLGCHLAVFRLLPEPAFLLTRGVRQAGFEVVELVALEGGREGPNDGGTGERLGRARPGDPLRDKGTKSRESGVPAQGEAFGGTKREPQSPPAAQARPKMAEAPSSGSPGDLGGRSRAERSPTSRIPARDSPYVQDPIPAVPEARSRPESPTPAVSVERDYEQVSSPKGESLRPSVGLGFPESPGTPTGGNTALQHPVGQTQARGEGEEKIDDRGRSGGIDPRGAGSSAVAGATEISPHRLRERTGPEIETTPSPRYPRTARRNGMEGEVQLVVVVSENGEVVRVQVKNSSGYGILDQAAVKAVWGWRFRPAREEGVAVRSRITVPVRFLLEGPG